MIQRQLHAQLLARLQHTPAIALLGPRQAGKTTLAHHIAETIPSIYLDLESDADRARLAEPELYLASHEEKLVILDEVQRMPEIFSTLRGLIDRGRRKGLKAGRFLLLGSASHALLQQSGESLAGRIAYMELHPFTSLELASGQSDRLWLRGGFPDSFLAVNDALSLAWRKDFIRTYLERDIPQLGPRIPAETLRRFWTMLAHSQGGMLNAAALARGLGVDGKTIARYLDLLVDLLLVRRLPPWHFNTGKRLVKSPRVYVRDSGILHALLGLTDTESLLGHPVVGASWESFVIETLLAAAPADSTAYFYRTAAGAEIDLLLNLPDGSLCAIEVKRSLTPTVGKGFYHACADLKPAQKYVVYPGSASYPVREGLMAIHPNELARQLFSGL